MQGEEWKGKQVRRPDSLKHVLYYLKISDETVLMKHLRDYKINSLLLKTEEQLKKKKRVILEREGEYEEGQEQRQADSALSRGAQ